MKRKEKQNKEIGEKLLADQSGPNSVVRIITHPLHTDSIPGVGVAVLSSFYRRKQTKRTP